MDQDDEGDGGGEGEVLHCLHGGPRQKLQGNDQEDRQGDGNLIDA